MNLDGRRFAVTRSVTPLCIGKIETPDRSTLLAVDDACVNNAGPAVEHGAHSRHGTLALLDDIGHHRKHLKMWQNVSSSFCSACFLKATLMCQGIPHVGHGVPGVVIRPHDRLLMD